MSLARFLMSDCNTETERQCYALEVSLHLLNLNGALIMNPSDKNELHYRKVIMADSALFIWIAIY